MAAWVEGMIMNIWPFGAENGKLARLVTSVLWRYCGVVVAIGDGEKEVEEEYLEIVRRFFMRMGLGFRLKSKGA